MIVESSGLAPLRRHLSYRYIDRALVSAFVERSQPETNTFHLPFGEMAITLDDVSVILGIPIVATLVHAPTQLSLLIRYHCWRVVWEWIKGLPTQSCPWPMVGW